MLLALVQAHSPVYRCFRALWRGKVAALAFVSVSHPGMWYKACFCLCLHCTDEAHIGRNRGSPVCNIICINFGDILRHRILPFFGALKFQ